MSNDSTSGVSSASPTDETHATGETETSTASGKPAPTSNTIISSMEQMRKEYPDLYQKILVSMAQNICIQVNRGNDRLIRKMKELRQG